MPDKNKIMLCANTMMMKQDFDNALARHLILMYDYNRSKSVEGSYDPNKCKHLACSEVRAALFSDQCKIRKHAMEMFKNKNESEKFDAQKYCFKDLAITHLKEKAKCKDKANLYVDFVFEQCLSDRSPFVKGRNQTRNFTEIL